jgi:hypothetical protein
MAEQSKNSTSTLLNLFNEIDQVKLSNSDLDKELESLGMVSDDVVAEGLRKVNNLVMGIEPHDRFYMPIAASNKDDLKKEDLDKLLDDDKSQDGK